MEQLSIGMMRKNWGVVLFLAIASVLVGIIVYGALTNDLSPQFGHILVLEKRTLPTRTAKGVHARLYLKDLETDPPVLVVESKGLNQKTPLELWLVDATGTKQPIPVPKRVEVDDEGRAKGEVKLPKEAIRHYSQVEGKQNRRTVFQAPLG